MSAHIVTQPPRTTATQHEPRLDGAGLLARRGRRGRGDAVAVGYLLLAGELLLRPAVFRAGFQSADAPRHTARPPQERLARRPRPVRKAVA